MNPTPSPTPLDVFVHSGPAEWWQIVAALGPLAILLGALVAWFTLRQRSKSDRQALQQKTDADSRAEWWRRTQWALDQALASDRNTKALGLAALAVLTRSELARKEELELLDIAWQAVNGTSDSDDEQETSDETGVMDSDDNIGDNGTTSEDIEEGRP
ncbi:hypothetical protein J7E83_06125 [Arthrobacter sp. ISL-48]|uniref:hypothetical protein n=1 Tax=Arthrobacter sp. ISL-48 TaxID=2819110 RepID=UPI001BE94D19|nr:hypothetical protein [Arthrobacter sp. ISL-48]MBT2531703.1 hypothetical protein [Arthrobacter sp. ISL-48]